MIKVSVIIPVYNAEDFLRPCLDSILGQTLQEIEVICVDDGSTDSSWSILESYEQADARVRIFRQENAGAGAARNTGLAYAAGEYLSFLDSDDFFEPDMLEQAYRHAKEADAQIAVFACDLYDNALKSYRDCKYAIHTNLLPEHQPFSGVDVKKDVFKLFVGWAWDKLFLASFVRENKLLFQEQRTTNDMLFVFSAVVKADRIITIDKILAHHRRAVESLSVTREKSWMCFYHALLALRRQLVDWNLYERFEQDFINYCVHFSLWNLNSLAEPTHTLLYNTLREEWYDELGVTKHPIEYFYNRHEYLQYRKVYEHPVDGQAGGKENKADARQENVSVFRRGITCLRKNGIRCTVKRFMHKLRRKLRK